MSELNRRAFFKNGAVLASGAALMGFAGCAPRAEGNNGSTDSSEGLLPVDLQQSDIENSLVELASITEFVEEQTYDIVVVGAGCAGVPAVLTAVEEGATVACLQKQDSVQANGYGASAVYRNASTEAGMNRWMHNWSAANNYRINTDLFKHHMEHSEETISWVTQRSAELGIEFTNFKTSGSVMYEDGEVAAIFEISTPGNTVVMTEFAKLAEEKGAVFYYETPAVQLIQADDGAVTGVIGKNAQGEYIKLNANKGVVLATGDYMNNDSLTNRYSRDVHRKYLYLQNDRTGDGHILGILAGARIAPPCHPRQVHGLIPWFMTIPLLTLNGEGERFMNEDVHMTAWNSVLSYHFKEDEETYIYRFFDSDYATKYAGMGALPPKDDVLDKSIDEGTPSSAYDFHNAFHRGETIEELCEIVGLPSDAVVASIKRYNELCASGSDEDFGVEGSIMKPIENGPFYCIKDLLGLAAINAGFTVDKNYQAIDADGNLIPGLYGAGVCADNICGGINWGMPGGSSNSHCFASGRYTVLNALKGELVPTTPCTFEEVADYFKDAKTGLFQWESPQTARKQIEIW